MEVYIETVILDNMVINTILLVFTNVFLHLHAKKRNIFFAALFGTVFAIAMPLITLHWAPMLALKLLVGVCMVAILKPKQTAVKRLLCFVWFLTFTFAMGGVCFGILQLFGASTSLNGILMNGFTVPISLFVLLLTLYAYLLYKSLAIMTKKQTLHCLTFSLIMKHNNHTFHLEGFLDSGNRLYDKGKPIIIISKQTFEAITQTNANLTGAHYLAANSIHSNSNLLVFPVQEVTIFTQNNQMKTFHNLPAGVANSNFNSEFDCLLHSDLFA